MTPCRLILTDSMLSLLGTLDKKLKIGYDIYKGYISTLNENLIK